MSVHASVDRTGAAPRIWFIEQLDFFSHNVWLGDATGARRKLDLPEDAEVDFHRDWLAVKPRKPWTVGTRTYASDTVLGMSLSRFLAGERDFRILCVAGPRGGVLARPAREAAVLRAPEA